MHETAHPQRVRMTTSPANLDLNFVCPEHRQPLSHVAGETLSCPAGCRFPIVGGIPRFVPGDDYAYSFGLQWKRFRKTQLDSHTGLPLSRDRLTRLVGAHLEDFFAGKRVLEAGCGAGRFTELMLQAGATVVSADLSAAVEANAENCAGYARHVVCQADIRRLPLPPESFDVVVCIGVIQHTPVPEETIAALARHLAPGGQLVIDHYKPRATQLPATSRLLRRRLLSWPSERSLRFVEGLVNALWPMHKSLYRVRKARWFTPVRKFLLRMSPVLDYQYMFPDLSPQLLHEFAVLDTHDCHTDVYQHRRTREDIQACLQGLGLDILYLDYAGNGVEARALRPQQS